jgi:xanthine/CO dehydrogenase XdhC/CoxF family maturation factor
MVERKVIDAALEALRERASRMFHGRMARTGSDAVGSDCGGAMSVYISVRPAPAPAAGRRRARQPRGCPRRGAGGF